MEHAFLQKQRNHSNLSHTSNKLKHFVTIFNKDLKWTKLMMCMSKSTFSNERRFFFVKPRDKAYAIKRITGYIFQEKLQKKK